MNFPDEIHIRRFTSLAIRCSIGNVVDTYWFTRCFQVSKAEASTIIIGNLQAVEPLRKDSWILLHVNLLPEQYASDKRTVAALYLILIDTNCSWKFIQRWTDVSTSYILNDVKCN